MHFETQNRYTALDKQMLLKINRLIGIAEIKKSFVGLDV